MKTLVITKRAAKALARMTPTDAGRVRAKIDQYHADPASLSANVKKLQGRDGYRLRIGDWRVIFDEDGAVLAILDIGARGGIYD